MAYSYIQGPYSANYLPKGASAYRKLASRLYYQITNTATTYRVDVYGQGTIYNDNMGTTLYGQLNLTGTAQTTGSRKYTYKSSGTNHKDVYYTLCDVKSYTWTKQTYAQSGSASMYVYWSCSSSRTSTASTSFSIPALASYSIVYNANGGTSAPGTQTKYYDRNIALQSSQPTRTGYTFVGWSTSANPSYTAVSNPTGSPANNGYYESVEGIFIRSVDLEVDPSKTYYYIVTQYQPGATYTGNAALTLYAQWYPNVYTITYNSGGGTGTMADNHFVYDQTYTLSKSLFHYTDMLFAGWVQDTDNTSIIYADEAPVSNLTTSGTFPLKATWQYQYSKADLTQPLAWRREENISGNIEDSDTGNYARAQITVEPAKQRTVLNGDFSYISTEVRAGYKLITSSEYIMHPTSYIINDISTLIWDFDPDHWIGENIPTFTPLSVDTQYDIIFISRGLIEGVEKITNNITTFISTAEFALDINADGSSFGLFSIAPGTYVEEVDETNNQTTANRVKTVSINGDLLLAIDENAGKGYIDNILIQLLSGLGWEVTVNPQDVVQTSSGTES